MPERPYLILHGHFYQPPRKTRGRTLSTGSPRLTRSTTGTNGSTKQCYAANAASRVLDSSGRIKDIVNNYEYLSFNVGPTLMDWIAEFDDYAYRKIVEADRASASRNNGHGNAIAQVYNHIIMPLASDEDKKTQIVWA